MKEYLLNILESPEFWVVAATVLLAGITVWLTLVTRGLAKTTEILVFMELLSERDCWNIKDAPGEEGDPKRKLLNQIQRELVDDIKKRVS